ncbi:MAG TPA: glycine--tRNA ligase subunit beta [Desulfobacteraceae bacterium]|nr:glycine--tRNA ligase subunit beta [Desulfobacteraceae bacterium]
MSELLFEIGTEEIPAGYIQPALQFIREHSGNRFRELGLDHGEIKTMGTPRRLAMAVYDLQEKQPDRVVEHIGPAAKAGFDEAGNPTRAAAGFARSRGLAVEELKIAVTPKGEYLAAVEQVKGRDTLDLLPDLLATLVRTIPFPKSMRWGEGTITFARPIQWLLALYDGEPLELVIDDLRAGTVTRGHRFMAPDPFSVAGSRQYIDLLRERRVLVEPEERREAVVRQVRMAVDQRSGRAGAVPVLDEELIDTVTNLVEMPWGICGRFDARFLELPREVLITSMREHQKYFPVAGSDGSLLPLFVAVNNTLVEDFGLAASGHQRVLRARLEDALFFFREDKKRKLADRYPDLAGIVFHHRLGTMLEKSERVTTLARCIAGLIDPSREELVARAAMLAKCDLLTEMVGEFPSLQGIIGREYASLDGEASEVADAVHEHYKPVRAGGELPAGLIGAIVGLADRIDTLAGCFAIGEKPTGTTDPFGLRRQALGLLHILQHHRVHLSLTDLVGRALDGYRSSVEIVPGAVEQIVDFIRLRFENDVIASGTRPEVVAAATSVGFDDAADCMARVRGLEAIRAREEFTVLAGSFKRIRNIVKENRETAIDERLFADAAEKELHSTFLAVKTAAAPFLDNRQYDEALGVMLRMKEPVDRFFDQVMVMTEDEDVRRNRLNLLTALGQLVLRVGDISRMHLEGTP